MFDLWRTVKKESLLESKENIVSTKMPISLPILKDLLSGSNDITFRDINLGKNEIITLCYVEGLVNIPLIDETILKPIVNEQVSNNNLSVKDVYSNIKAGLIYHAAYSLETDINKCVDAILSGNVCLIGNKENTSVLFEVKGFERRGLSEPSEENVLKGSKDCFIEVLRINTALIRRKIRNKDLKIEETTIGNEGKTNVAIIYLDNKVDKAILSELKSKINNIKIDNLITTDSFEEQLVPSHSKLFPQLLYTERPDKLCSNIDDRKNSSASRWPSNSIYCAFCFFYVYASTRRLFF